MWAVETFISKISEPDKATEKANEFLLSEECKNSYEIINIRTAANDYYFYITIIMKDK